MKSMHASSGVYNTSRSYKISSQTQDGCCDDQYPGLQGTYRSFQQPVLPLPSTRYCDSVATNDPDPFVIKAVLNDLSCVIDKTYGTNVSLKGRSNELECELERLRQELKCCECCKCEMESEMLKLQADFKQSQYALDELISAKSGLEIIVAQLREQLVRQEESLDCESQEKTRHLNLIKELEMKLKNCEGTMNQLEVERNEFGSRYHELEEFRNGFTRMANGKIGELEDALNRCCQQNESFRQEIDCLRSEILEIRGQVETLQYEKKRMIDDFEYAKGGWSNQKSSMDCLILDLQRKLASCEDQKKDICEKMTAIVSEHHVEMDKLSDEAAQYRDMCDSMNKELETLRKKLKDCEDQKRGNGNAQQEPASLNMRSGSPENYNFTNNLSSYQNQNYSNQGYSNHPYTQVPDRSKEIDDMRFNLNAVNDKAAALERDLQQTQQLYDDKVIVCQQFEVDLERSANSQKVLELELVKLQNEAHRYKSEYETAQDSIADLQKELEIKTKTLEEKLAEDTINQNNDLTREETIKKEYEELVEKANCEVSRLSGLLEITEAKVVEANVAQKQAEEKYATILKSAEEMQEKLGIWSPVVSEVDLLRKETSRLQKELNDARNHNIEKKQAESIKKNYEELLEQANDEVAKLTGLLEITQAKVVEANSAQTRAEEKCEAILQSAEEMEEKLGVLDPVASEAEFYKKEATRMQKELKDREIKVTELTRDLQLVKEGVQNSELNISDVLDKDRTAAYHEYQLCDLREKLRTLEIEKGRLREIIKNLEERLQFIQPRLEVAFDERKSLEEKVIVMREENNRLLKTAEEERHNRDLFQRKLKDAQGLWESEVKAKGILAEKIANYERLNNYTEERNQQESSEVEKWKDKFRALRSELKAERELVTKLKNKFDQAKEQCRLYKVQIEKITSDPKIRKLQILLEEQKLKFEDHLTKLKNEREHLVSEIFRLGQSNEAMKRELKKLSEEIQLYEAEKTTLENIVKSKDRLEVELKNLKRAIDDQYVDKTELERLKAAYDMQIATVKSQYEHQVQLGVDRKYSEITKIMDKQARDRLMIDQIRESNENILRTELSTSRKSSQLEIENLKRQVREQEEQIKSEMSSRRLITEKFSAEKKRNEELYRKLEILGTARSDTLLSLKNNNNNEILEE